MCLTAPSRRLSQPVSLNSNYVVVNNLITARPAAGHAKSSSSSTTPEELTSGSGLGNKTTDEISPKPKRRRKPQKPGFTAKGDKRHFVQHEYHDHSQDKDEGDHNGCQSTRKARQKLAPGNEFIGAQFPLKLHVMLAETEKMGLAHIISWLPHGRAFIVHKPKDFVEHIMPCYFKQSKLTSFQRQLNLYGFVRLTRGDDNGGYYHELFLRGKSFLTRSMVRTRVKGTKFKATSSPLTEPDFYSMPVLSPLTDLDTFLDMSTDSMFMISSANAHLKGVDNVDKRVANQNQSLENSKQEGKKFYVEGREAPPTNPSVDNGPESIVTACLSNSLSDISKTTHERNGVANQRSNRYHGMNCLGMKTGMTKDKDIFCNAKPDYLIPSVCISASNHEANEAHISDRIRDDHANIGVSSQEKNDSTLDQIPLHQSFLYSNHLTPPHLPFKQNYVLSSDAQKESSIHGFFSAKPDSIFSSQMKQEDFSAIFVNHQSASPPKLDLSTYSESKQSPGYEQHSHPQVSFLKNKQMMDSYTHSHLLNISSSTVNESGDKSKCGADFRHEPEVSKHGDSDQTLDEMVKDLFPNENDSNEREWKDTLFEFDEHWEY